MTGHNEIAQGRQTHRRRGMTLIELLAAVGVGSLVLAAVGSLTVFTARSFEALKNYDSLDRYSRNALDTMSREIRQTRALTYYQTNKLIFLDRDGATNLTYFWNPVTLVLTRQKASATTVLLTNCDSLVFQISQRNPSNGFNFYPAANAAGCKLINVTWICSRQVLGTTANTESLQTAKIVMRN